MKTVTVNTTIEKAEELTANQDLNIQALVEAAIGNNYVAEFLKEHRIKVEIRLRIGKQEEPNY